MKVSTRGEYGVRAMLDLALRYGQGPVSLKSIAERQNISEHYLEQLMSSLRKAGLVNSVRGAQGGYELADAPGKITTGDIVRTLEGPIAPIECVDDSSNGPECDLAERCATRVLWARLRKSMEAVLDSTTLQDLCDEAASLKARDDSFMYHI